MKKFILLAFVAAFPFFTARAQENGLFNHLSAGVTLGTAGGGLELAAPLGPKFQVRAGYSMVPDLGIKMDFDVPEHPGNASSGNDQSVTFKGSLVLSNAELFFDFFPSKTGGFHITAGFLAGSDDIIKIKNSTPLPSDYNTVGIDVGGKTVRATNNYLTAYVRGSAFKPYFGVGFGWAVDSGQRVKFVFDLGCAYLGKLGAYAPGEGLTGNIEDVKLTSADLDDRDEGWVDKAENFGFWPMLNFKLYVRLF